MVAGSNPVGLVRIRGFSPSAGEKLQESCREVAKAARVQFKVFISWSGEDSKKIALILRDWLPTVLQQIKPFVSDEDIEKGSRWGEKIGAELEAGQFGIICITPGNSQSRWLNFEAGALSRDLREGRVAPFLMGVTHSDLSGEPLAQFQATSFERSDVWKLILSINATASPNDVDEGPLRTTFESRWPDLEARLQNIELSERRPATSIVKESESTGTGKPVLDGSAIRVLQSIFMAIEASNIGQAELASVSRQSGFNKTRTEYYIDILERHDLALVLVSEECKLTAKGRAYLVENGLIP